MARILRSIGCGRFLKTGVIQHRHISNTNIQELEKAFSNRKQVLFSPCIASLGSLGRTDLDVYGYSEDSTGIVVKHDNCLSNGDIETCSVSFDELYSDGFEELDYICKTGSSRQPVPVAALLRFLAQKGGHENSLLSLHKQFSAKAEKLTKGEMCAILAVHLVSQLVLESTTPCMLSNNIKIRTPWCPCGACQSEVTYGNTRFGSEELWYVKSDIMIFPVGAGGVSVFVKQNLKEEYNRERSAKNVKLESKEIPSLSSISQNTMKAITFSFVQKVFQKNRGTPESEVVSLIPTVVFCDDRAHVYMYDSKYDICLKSENDALTFWNESTGSPKLDINTVITLWMMFNHLTFNPRFSENIINQLKDSCGFQENMTREKLEKIEKSISRVKTLQTTCLPPSCLSALSKFLPNYEAGEANIRVMRDILSKMAARESNIDVQLNVKLWRVPGCHEFFASLGLDLVEVGRDDVTLRLGEQAVRRQLQFALQSLVAIFDTQETPRSLTLDSSSSLESLSSSHSGSTSTSNFSKGSTPLISPRCSKKKSLFNPAEMEKMRMMTKMQLMNQGGLSGRKVSAKSSKSGTDPSLNLSHQNKIKNMYPPAMATVALHSDIDEMQEIVSENSESEGDSRRSEGANSWNDFRMQVSSANSESDGSTIPEGRSSESEPLKTIHEQVDDGKDEEAREDFEEYTFSRQTSEMSSTDEAFQNNFDWENSNRLSNMSTTGSDVERAYFENQNVNRNSYSDDDAFHRDDVKRQSDMSDTSGISDNFITSKSLELALPSELVTENGQFSSESGINSEVTSNQSDARQQSVDVTQFTINASEIALRVLADVGSEREALEEVQSQSFVLSQSESYNQRKQFFQSLSSGGNSSNFKAVQQLMNGGPVTTSVSRPDKIKPPVPQRGFKVPPPVPVKPKQFQNLVDNFQKRTTSDKNQENNSVKSNVNTMANNREKSESYDFEDDLSYTITTSSNRKGVKILKPGESGGNMMFCSFKPPQKGNFILNNGRPESSASLSSIYSTGSSVQTVIFRSHQGASPNVGSHIPSPEQFFNGRRQSPATSGSDNDIKIRTGLSQSSWYNVDSDSSQNALFEKRCSNSSLSSASSYSDINQPRKTKSILNNSPNNPRPRGKKPRKRVSFSDSEPSDLDSSNHSRSLHDISPVDGYISPLNRSRNIYQGFHSRTPSPYANKTVPKQNQNSAGNDSVKWEPVIINGGIPHPVTNGPTKQEPVLNGSVPNLTGNSVIDSNFRGSTGTIPNLNKSNGSVSNYSGRNGNVSTFMGTTFPQQGSHISPQTTENRNLSTFGRSAFNHMRAQPQNKIQLTNSENTSNFTGSTFQKRQNSLNSQSSDHIQMLYSGQQKSPTARPQQVLQSSKC